MKKFRWWRNAIVSMAAFTLVPMLTGQAWAGFTPGPNLAQARWSHGSVLLQNGKVLIVGGQLGSTMVNTAELYDPATNTLSPAGSMAEAHGNRSGVVRLANGKVLVISGWNATGSWTNTVELYDPAANTWTTVAPLVTARVAFGAVLLPNGKVLVTGGQISDGNVNASAEIYDPVANTWSPAAPMSLARMHTESNTVLLPNGKVMVAGGWSASGVSAAVEVYDPSTNSWASAAPMQTSRYRGTMTLLANGKVLAVGGIGSSTVLSSVELCDPVSNIWAAAASLPVPRVGHTATLLPSGDVLLGAGDGSTMNTAISAQVYTYNVTANTWSLAGNMTTPRMEHAAVALPDGRVFLSGGLIPGNAGTATTELFDPKHLMGGAIQGTPIKVEPAVVSTFAGTAGTVGSMDGTGAAARFNNPVGVTTDGTNLYVAESTNHTIRKVVIATGAVSTLAGSAGVTGTADGTGTEALFNNPYQITTDGTNLYVADGINNTIRKIVIDTGVVSTLAGSAGEAGFGDGIGTAARFSLPFGITTDGTNLYVTDANNYTIRKIVIATGEVTTLAGSAGISGSIDATGAAARFSGPRGITTDGVNLYVAQWDTSTIRKVEIATGAVTTFAGSAGSHGSADGTGAAARFTMPHDITTDGTYLYVADWRNYMIRKVVIATGEVTTIAGKAGTSGSDDGIATAARFNDPVAITTDGTNLYVADCVNHTIRKIVGGDLTTGLVAYYPFNGNANDESENGNVTAQVHF